MDSTDDRDDEHDEPADDDHSGEDPTMSTGVVEPRAAVGRDVELAEDVPTVTGVQVGDDRPAPAPPADPPPGSTGSTWSGLSLTGLSLTILGALLLGFVVQVLVVGHLRHHRAQVLAYDDFRADLARAEAPVGQTDAEGRLLPLGTSVAIIRIPALQTSEVVGEGTTSGVLANGPGHRRDTPLPGQAGTSVVMGRQFAYGGPFGNIEKLPNGSQIIVTTGQGTHTYTVTGRRYAGDPQPARLTEGQGRLTLITATGPWFAPDDVVRVDASLTSPAQPAPARPIAPGTVPAAEQAMGGEAGAWIAIVLWAQALLLAALFATYAVMRWGRWQTWIIAVPVLGVIGLALADQVMRLAPNLF